MLTLLAASILTMAQGAKATFIGSHPFPGWLGKMKLTSQPTYVNARKRIGRWAPEPFARIAVDGEMLLSGKEFALALNSRPRELPRKTFPVRYGKGYYDDWEEGTPDRDYAGYRLLAVVDNDRLEEIKYSRSFDDSPEKIYRYADARLRARYGPPTKVFRVKYPAGIRRNDRPSFLLQVPWTTLVETRAVDQVLQVWCWGKGRFENAALAKVPARKRRIVANPKGATTVVVLAYSARNSTYRDASGSGESVYRPLLSVFAFRMQ